jgi:hypothetical protein
LTVTWASSTGCLFTHVFQLQIGTTFNPLSSKTPTSAVGRIPFGEVEMITQSFYDEAKAKWEAIVNEPNQIKREAV